MNYDDLIKSHIKYGTTKEDILNRDCYSEIRENVVIAPWWKISIFEELNPKIERISYKLYNIDIKDTKFTFIELKEVGAPAIMDEILNLGVSKCKNIIFVGSVGSLSDKISIGDIVVPKYSITGDGASRYLNMDLKDEFGKKQYPNKIFTEQVLKILQKHKNTYQIHNAINFSVDSIFAQFLHIEYIKSLGAEVIEMETASAFKAAKLANIPITAILVVSDNSIAKKSLYSGRNEKDKEIYHRVRQKVIPKTIIEVFNS